MKPRYKEGDRVVYAYLPIGAFDKEDYHGVVVSDDGKVVTVLWDNKVTDTNDYHELKGEANG